MAKRRIDSQVPAKDTQGRPPTAHRESPRPFLKWAGGKGQLVPYIRPWVPTVYSRYFEPFAGGAALFFALTPRDAVLSDTNGELVDCFTAVRDHVDKVILRLGSLRYDEKTYYRIRSQVPSTLPLAERAARTIFLNRTCFNGLFRVNSSGQFNVPFGRYKNPTICDEPNLRACSAALKRAVLSKEPFASVLDGARPGDFVYFDPPYAPVKKTSFIAYSAARFGWLQHEGLARVFQVLADRGCTVLLSNADLPEVRRLYAGFPILSVSAVRRINSQGSGRGAVQEILVVWDPAGHATKAMAGLREQVP